MPKKNILFNQPTIAEQRFGIGLGATEAFVERHGLFTASHLEDVLAEAASGGLVEDALLLEGFEAVGVEDFGPQVAVVAYGIATAEDVVEVGAAVAEGDFGDEANLLGDGLLEGVGIKVGVVGEHVVLHVEQGSSHQLYGLEATVER